MISRYAGKTFMISRYAHSEKIGNQII
jgi:hypothetical protein